MTWAMAAKGGRGRKVARPRQKVVPLARPRRAWSGFPRWSPHSLPSRGGPAAPFSATHPAYGKHDTANPVRARTPAAVSSNSPGVSLVAHASGVGRAMV